ncbi:hypothetical protein FDI40_gp098 [Agrobacterium phage Atu_ph07]|uniref:Uncharacterized protein n=1 Tax=Agrobacterium phage Atu_ph07 TaxID=2024264 RepID=A0A2L0UZG0_9CAUD|nr:hypothetical protein FDI40_gp098 [Agrobacterium phage Atu_ph07]AUZ94900.1 hypothetical protein [Agrobacterium phage Atu_ph07]
MTFLVNTLEEITHNLNNLCIRSIVQFSNAATLTIIRNVSVKQIANIRGVIQMLLGTTYIYIIAHIILLNSFR